MVSCTSDTIPDYQPQIVVEGWIENGHAPVVRLYCTVPVNNNENKQEDLYNNTIDDANVAITCDDQTYVLHHEINQVFIPATNLQALQEEVTNSPLRPRTGKN